LDACADPRLGAAERIRIAVSVLLFVLLLVCFTLCDAKLTQPTTRSNAIELVHYLNDFPIVPDIAPSSSDDEANGPSFVSNLINEGGNKVRQCLVLLLNCRLDF
jgi:hypothetical protein